MRNFLIIMTWNLIIMRKEVKMLNSYLIIMRNNNVIIIKIIPLALRTRASITINTTAKIF